MSGFIFNDFTKGSGLIAEHLQGGATIAAYSLVYIDGNGQWSAADASLAATMPAIGLATEPLRLNQKGRVLQQGYASSNTWAWTPGGEIYASDTTGALSQTPGTVAQVVGVAIAATIIYFDGAGLIASGTISLTDVYISGTLYVDTINEFTLNAGVTIDGVLIKDGAMGIDSETQVADIAVPTTTPIGEGHIIKVLYTQYTPDRIVLWTYDLTNTDWFGVELLG